MGVNLRRLALDVEKSLQRPELMAIVEAADGVEGVQGVNLLIDEIDAEAMGVELVVEGEGIDFGGLIDAIEQTGAVVRSLDEVAVVPGSGWIAVPIAIAMLALLGAAVAAAIDGATLHWSLALAAGGLAMTAVGYELRIA
jgi:hypothetical protein